MKYLRTFTLGAVFVGLNLVMGTASAQTVIYKEVERETMMGRGFTTPQRSQSYIIYSTATHRPLALIRSSILQGFRYYSVRTNLSEFNVIRGIVGAKGNETMFFQSTASTNSFGTFTVYAYFARGRDATLELGNGTTVDLPRTLKATTRTVNNVLGAPYVWEATSTMQFQPQETRLANAETLQQTIERIRTRLEAQGYERTPNSA